MNEKQFLFAFDIDELNIKHKNINLILEQTI